MAANIETPRGIDEKENELDKLKMEFKPMLEDLEKDIKNQAVFDVIDKKLDKKDDREKLKQVFSETQIKEKIRGVLEGFALKEYNWGVNGNKDAYLLQLYANLYLDQKEVTFDGIFGGQTLAILRGLQGRVFTKADKHNLKKYKKGNRYTKLEGLRSSIEGKKDDLLEKKKGQSIESFEVANLPPKKYRIIKVVKGSTIYYLEVEGETDTFSLDFESGSCILSLEGGEFEVTKEEGVDGIFFSAKKITKNQKENLPESGIEYETEFELTPEEEREIIDAIDDQSFGLGELFGIQVDLNKLLDPVELDWDKRFRPDYVKSLIEKGVDREYIDWLRDFDKLYLQDQNGISLQNIKINNDVVMFDFQEMRSLRLISDWATEQHNKGHRIEMTQDMKVAWKEGNKEEFMRLFTKELRDSIDMAILKKQLIADIDLLEDRIGEKDNYKTAESAGLLLNDLDLVTKKARLFPEYGEKLGELLDDYNENLEKYGPKQVVAKTDNQEEDKNNAKIEGLDGQSTAVKKDDIEVKPWPDQDAALDIEKANEVAESRLKLTEKEAARLAEDLDGMYFRTDVVVGIDKGELQQYQKTAIEWDKDVTVDEFKYIDWIRTFSPITVLDKGFQINNVRIEGEKIVFDWNDPGFNQECNKNHEITLTDNMINNYKKNKSGDAIKFEISQQLSKAADAAVDRIVESKAKSKAKIKRDSKKMTHLSDDELQDI